ncbi:hypothetical protein C4552_04470 [Candidatus Parcubacteria bacterium]|nr:MAG: hypothetical protein C4552_04470 [Candidatus Parcubacteria bacterium]
MTLGTNAIGKIAFQAVVLMAIVGTALWLGQIAENNTLIQSLVSRYGYAGAFFISVFSGFNFIAPFPAVSFFPLLVASGLNPVAVLAIMTVGMTIADSIAYLAGRIGRHIAGALEERIRERLDRIRLRRHWEPIALLFLFAAFVPLPNELIVIPLGFIGYRLWSLVPVLLLGNATFNTLAAFGIINLAGAL